MTEPEPIPRPQPAPDRAELIGAGESLAQEFGLERLLDLLHRDVATELPR